ncbi:hypothetical protein I6A84_42645 [Frankia sp. CNm7]|uniref:AttH domain-containing protein n=1 Tax=Frankia nepalensis TaxID=1836974 RepID=A0A937RSS8_9ACTN|nr:hypothetical protein [Frankia nepalensis]MBL7501077.1 hypothetical protein [Frankia nepalensis]MBL7514714.1 hypothetical protein [Frankia nepalensis]MBL7524565.1 hypothetical protein [Frankia nepalensis]MBL7631271.1 hypothetical protein [Frankia nepalensis]
MPEQPARFSAADENLHASDPDEWSWNESWYFSFIDLDGGPAGFFRLGLLPNQRRAMLWCFVHVDGAWLGVEETRLDLDHFDLAAGHSYDRWALRFGWRPEPPLDGARFTFAGTLLARSGPGAGAHVPVSIDLVCAATSACVGAAPGAGTAYPTDRFEQSLRASGTVVVDGVERQVRAGAHRDRSWGPREWRLPFAIGDLQGGDRQLYFVGSPRYGRGSGYLREGSGEPRRLSWAGGTVGYDDKARTITPGTLRFESADGEPIEVELEPIMPSVCFDMAHTCQEPEQWPYWRTLVAARVPGWDGPCRGWFEASRYEPR